LWVLNYFGGRDFTQEGLILRLIVPRLIFAFSFLLLSFAAATAQELSSSETVKLLPKTVGDFRSQSARPLASLGQEFAPESFGVRGAAEGAYVSRKGERFTVTVIHAQSHAGAYSILTRETARLKNEAQSQLTKLNGVGVAGVAAQERVAFYKGTVFVSIAGKSTSAGDGESNLVAFARAYSGTLPEAENEIPVLVKHLPDWETAQDRAIYSVSLPALQAAAGQQPIFEAINFNEGAEAVMAPYDAARLVIVEYTTPQSASDADARITARREELRAQGQSVPSAYRRVGNYSVFVFDAPDEAAAAQLIDRVKYEQKIQWLGENPLLWARAEKQHTRQAVSLFLGIAKTIGFFVALCLGAGGVVGGLFFLRRRAQRRAEAETYSDAGGMLRLNIDDMSPETDPAKLLGAGDEKPAVR
jgi:muconolactone delta-isomerase